ncbi:MAG: ribosome-associated translation inhibitor RaiA [Parvularculaceae bacterium]
MDVQISGQGLDLGAALQAHVQGRIESGVHKYFDRPAEAHVIFRKEGPDLNCEATAHLASGVFLAAEGRAQDAYGAFDEAMEKLEKRVRRYKRRLKNHHSNAKKAFPVEQAAAYVVKPAEDDEGDAPVVIAEQATQLRHMTVSDAVLQLDLADLPVMVFKNAAHGALSVVYKRPDGNIGWIDAQQEKSG